MKLNSKCIAFRWYQRFINLIMTDQLIPENRELLLPNTTQKKKRRYKISIGVSFCCAASFLILSIVLPFFTTWLIYAEAAKEQILAPENEFLWAHIPGSTETHIIRKFTFFNFTNPRQVLYLNHRPLLREIGGYAFYEKQDYLNTQYQGSELKFDFWLHFEQMEISRSPDEKVSIINFVPMGLWYTIKNTDVPTFCQQGLALMSFNLRDSLKEIIISQAVSKEFLPDLKTFSQTASKSDISAELTKILWSDPNYGLNDPDHFQMWVNAATNRSSDDYRILTRYFNMKSVPMNSLLDNLRDWSIGLTGVVENWYCGNSSSCTNDDLTFMQLSQSSVTSRPPPGVDPTDTFCSLNATCNGYPEIYSYLKYVFPKEYPNRSDLFNLSFSPELLRKWFYPSKQTYCILHVGNMGYLWEQGRLYDSTGNQENLINLQNRFALNTSGHTFVFWGWMKYMTLEFVLQNKSKNGTVQQLGVGGAVANSYMSTFIPAEDWLINYLVSVKVAWKIKNFNGTCESFMDEIFDDLTDKQKEAICHNVSLTNQTSVLELINVCEFEFMDQWVAFQNYTKLTDVQMLQFCDPDSTSIKSLTDLAYQELKNQYGCKLGGKCTGFELVLKQWNNSLITLNPPKEVPHVPSLTLNTWNKDFLPFEYSFYLDFMKSNSTFRPSFDEMVKLFSWDFFFSALRNQELMLETDPVIFKKKFFWDQMDLLKSYFKYISIEVSFGGLAVERTVREHLFGYEDSFIKQLKELDPAMGGDPSLSTWIALNEPNSTEEQAKLYPQSMNTGRDDIKQLRQYKTMNGLPYVNINYSYFDGNDIQQGLKSPWAENDPLGGTDGSRGAPQMIADPEQNDYRIFIPAIYRIGKAKYNTTFRMYDLDVYDMRIAPETLASSREFPANKKYYMGFTGFINITTISFAPFFVSKNHFYDCPKNWSTLIDIVDESGQHYQNASWFDDCFIFSEPITGISFSATIFLQTSYLYEQDFLFERPGMMMLPIFSLWRSANVSQSVVNQYFALVRLGLGVVHNALWVGLLVCGLFLIFGGWLIFKYRKFLKKERGEETEPTRSEIADEARREELMISLQPQHREEETNEQAPESIQAQEKQ